MARKRKKRRSSHILSFLSKLVKILFICAAACCAGFAAMYFYMRLPDEETVDTYLSYISSHEYADAYDMLDIPDEDVLLDEEHFAAFAENFYKDGTYDVEKASGYTKDAPVFTIKSEGSSDRQVLDVKLVKDDSGDWKIDAGSITSVLHCTMPSGFGLSFGNNVLMEISDEESMQDFRVFASEYVLNCTSEIFSSFEKTVCMQTSEKEGSFTVESKEIALSSASDDELASFAEELGKVYTQDICNNVTVDTVLDPESYPVYSSAVTDLAGDYLGADFDPAIPWQIELEEGCRSTFYTVFADSPVSVNTSGSFSEATGLAFSTNTRLRLFALLPMMK